MRKFIILMLTIIFMATQTISSQFICIDVVNDSLINVNKTSNNSSQKANSKSNSTYVLNRYLRSNNSDFSLGDEQILYDLNNNPHYRYNILYKGIPVHNYQYTVHSAGDTLNTITGLGLFSEDISIIPNISEFEAIKLAKTVCPSQTYFWEAVELEEMIKQKTGDSLASYYPNPELMIFKANNALPILVYRIELSSVSPLFSYEVFISATDGSLVYKNEMIYDVSPAVGMAELHLHGEKTIQTSFDNDKYILFDQVHNIKTYDLDRDTLLSSAEIYEDDNNIWSLSEFQENDINSKNAGLVCHWASSVTYDFFLNEFGRNGYDGNGSLVTIYTNFGSTVYGKTARWNNGMIIIGGGCHFVWPHHLGVLDVVAHEFAHGVTNSTANLQYYGEPGGICESISDIWAACVENYVGGRTHDQIWQMGEDMDTIMRNLYNPKSCGYPDTYNGLNWVDEKNPNGDFGGVHRKANVMNYWFYLLVNGGNGVNDNNHEYFVNGIGFDKSMKIVYNTLTLYLTPYSNFQDVRDKSLLAARNLYGNDSEEYISVMNAWHAVGVGNPYIPTTIHGEFGVCDGGTYFVENLPPMATISWSTDTFVDGLPSNPITKQKLSVINGQNTSDIVVERSALFMQEIGAETRRYVGDVTLCATITCNGVTSKIYKNLFANKKLELSCTNNLSNGIHPQHLYSYTFKANTLPDYLIWDIEEPGKAKRKVYGEQELILVGTTPGVIRVTVVDGGGCADYNSQTKTIINRSIEIAHKNPASYGENIQINTYICNDENNTFSTYSNNSKTPYPEEFVIELWSEEFGIVKRIESNSYTLELPLNGVIPGNYILRMTSKDGIILSTSQLMINQF